MFPIPFRHLTLEVVKIRLQGFRLEASVSRALNRVFPDKETKLLPSVLNSSLPCPDFPPQLLLVPASHLACQMSDVTERAGPQGLSSQCNIYCGLKELTSLSLLIKRSALPVQSTTSSKKYVNNCFGNYGVLVY